MGDGSRNVEIVRQIFVALEEGLAEGDVTIPWQRGLLATESEWFPDPSVAGPTSYRGAAGFAEFMRTWIEDFRDWKTFVDEAVDAGEGRVVVVARQRASGKASGVPVELRFGQVYYLTDGRVTQTRNYLDPQEAKKAAGLAD